MQQEYHHKPYRYLKIMEDDEQLYANKSDNSDEMTNSLKDTNDQT